MFDFGFCLWTSNCSNAISWKQDSSFNNFFFGDQLAIFVCTCIGLPALFHWSMYSSLPQYHTVWISCSLNDVLNPGNVIPPTLFFFLKIVLAIAVSFYTNFRVSSSVSIKKSWWDFERKCTSSIGENSHLYYVESSDLGSQPVSPLV